ncbi:MAG: hypothetical protein JWM05_75 [Acidimicrobiales bacterium]|nr:hypothetical protein [Acidimicrobiales bacterium]
MPLVRAGRHRGAGDRRGSDGLSAPALDRLLRPACTLALAVARVGGAAEPPIPAPEGLGRVLGFARLSAPAYATIRRVVDEDDTFRARVAEAADEAQVGRAGWLWLIRPDGWEDELTALATTDSSEGDELDERSPARLRRALAAAEERAERREGEARAARATAEALEARVDELARVQGETEARRAAAEERADVAGEGRRIAVRALKGVEAELADTRRDLKVARAALREAELQLAGWADAPSSPGADPAAPSPAPAPAQAVAAVAAAEPPAAPDASTAPSGIDLAEVRRAVDAASGAAEALARALGDAGRALQPEAAVVPPPVPVGPRTRSRRTRERAHRRRPATLPGGRLEDSVEGAGHLFRLPGVIVLVDGYNVARTAWSGLTPEEERARLVTALEGLHARTGAEVIAVFDGVEAAGAVSPAVSRTVKVRFSPDGVEADDVVRDLVTTLPVERPVVVVSSDREVADGARARGANVVSSRRFLAAIGR